jgi:predicted transcriptional regulator
MTEIEQSKALLALTAEIVSAHVKNNQVGTGDLPALIEQVFVALRDAGRVAAPVQVAARAEPERPAPVVSPKKSVFPDYIICLEDGRKLKTLKRHLRSTYNMTPEQYREKWDLAADYPMVAPNYAEHRSVLAKQLGLGRKPAKAKADAPELDLSARAVPPAPVAAPAPPVREAAGREPVAREQVAREQGARGHALREQVGREQVGREPAPERPRESRTEHTAASVFAKFPRPQEAAAEAPAPADSDNRKSRRKPFSKQLARTMRP